MVTEFILIMTLISGDGKPSREVIVGPFNKTECILVESVLTRKTILVDRKEANIASQCVKVTDLPAPPDDGPG